MKTIFEKFVLKMIPQIKNQNQIPGIIAINTANKSVHKDWRKHSKFEGVAVYQNFHEMCLKLLIKTFSLKKVGKNPYTPPLLFLFCTCNAKYTSPSLGYLSVNYTNKKTLTGVLTFTDLAFKVCK